MDYNDSLIEVLDTALTNFSGTIYWKNRSYTAQEVKQLTTDEFLELASFVLQKGIDSSKGNDLEKFSDQDVALADAIINSKDPGVYVGVKVLKRLVDRLSSSAYLSGKPIDNRTFLNNPSFSNLLKRLSSL